MSQRDPTRREFDRIAEEAGREGADDTTETTDDATTDRSVGGPSTGGVRIDPGPTSPPSSDTGGETTDGDPADGTVGGPSTGGATVDAGPTSPPADDGGGTTDGGTSRPDTTSREQEDAGRAPRGFSGDPNPQGGIGEDVPARAYGQAADLRERVASEYRGAVGPEDVFVRFDEDDNQLEARVTESGAREIGAREFGLEPGQVVAERTDGMFEIEPRVADLGGGADGDAVPGIGGEIADYEDLATDSGSQDPIGQTTVSGYDPDGPGQPSFGEAVVGGTAAFFRDPYGTTVEYGVEDLEANASEELGFDIGETAETTGETLAERPVDSFAQGVDTIVTGGEAASEDVSEDTAAAGVAASATGTGTGTATGILGGIGVTGAAAALPVGAAVFGARGIQEEDISLPATETAPAPGESTNELDVTRERFTGEVPVEESGFGEPEVSVGEGTGVGVTATRVTVEDAIFGGAEIDVGDESTTVPELPIGGGTVEAPTGGETGRSDSVVPGEYPQAGRDFPADPTREYVPGERVEPTARAAEQVGAGVLGELFEEEEQRQQITEEDLADPDELERRRREDFREQFERFQEDVRGEREFIEPPEEQFVSVEAGELDAEGEEFLIGEATVPLVTETTAQTPRQLPDVFAGTETRPMTGAAQEADVGTEQDQVTLTDTLFVQQTATEIGYGYPPDYPTEFPTQFGYPQETGTPGDGTPTPRLPELPEGDETDRERLRFGDVAEERVAEFFDPLGE